MNNNYDYGIVLTTVASEAQGKELAEILLKDKLAACINLFPIQSFYTWQDKINQDREWQLIIKTRLNLCAEITAKIQGIHNYEVPEIVVVPIVYGADSYLNWLTNSVK